MYQKCALFAPCWRFIFFVCALFYCAVASHAPVLGVQVILFFFWRKKLNNQQQKKHLINASECLGCWRRIMSANPFLFAHKKSTKAHSERPRNENDGENVNGWFVMISRMEAPTISSDLGEYCVEYDFSYLSRPWMKCGRLFAARLAAFASFFCIAFDFRLEMDYNLLNHFYNVLMKWRFLRMETLKRPFFICNQLNCKSRLTNAAFAECISSEMMNW